MATVKKIDEEHVSIEFDGLEYVISRKEAIELAAGITIAFIDVKNKPNPKKRRHFENGLTQFEVHTDDSKLAIEIEKKLHDIGLKSAEWTPSLTSGSFVMFITRSQKTIDKVNKVLGTKFTFDFLNNGNIYYL